MRPAFAWATAIVSSLFGLALLMPIPAGDKMSSRALACLSNIKQLALCETMYTTDYDDRLPQTSNWADASLPYAKDMSVFDCVSPEVRGGLGHALYRPSAGVNTAKMSEPAKALMLYDSADLSWNACGNLLQIPVKGRHPRDASTFAFVDGHCKLMSRRALFDFIKPKAFEP